MCFNFFHKFLKRNHTCDNFKNFHKNRMLKTQKSIDNRQIDSIHYDILIINWS